MGKLNALSRLERELTLRQDEHKIAAALLRIAELLSTLSSHAALALERTRLYARERRRAEELSTINRVARRVSASLDLQETLGHIVDAAAELVPCVLAEISLWDGEQQMLTLQALRCEPERVFPIGKTYPPGHGYTGWVVRHKQPLLVPNVDTYQAIQPDLLPGEFPFKAYVGLPLLAGTELIGTLVLIHEHTDAFDEEDLRLLKGLADQAAVAIRNAQLFQEVQDKARRLATLNAVASTVNQPRPLQEIMGQAIAKVVEVMGTETGSVHLLDQVTGELNLVSHQGLSPECVRREAHVDPESAHPVAKVARSGELLVVKPAHGAHDSGAVATARFQTCAIVPLRSGERVVGTLRVASRAPEAFGPADVEVLTSIGHQLSVAIENDCLREQALKAERLAAIGQVAASVAHDLRTPLGGVIRSAQFLARPEISDATRQKLSGAIVALARRLINTTQEILDYTRGEQMALRLAPCSLPEFLGQVIEVLRVDFSDRGIEVTEDWEYTEEVYLDADRMAQVVYNIAANARDAMPKGGRLTIATREANGWVEICFTDTGPGVPPQLRERIFDPLVSYGKQKGAGLGLAIARRIVQEHGGEIGIASHPQGGATFVVRLPLKR